MRKKIRLESLAVGRCFTLVSEPGGSTEETPAGAVRTGTILPASEAWKVVGQEAADYACVSASGESKSFGGDTEVVEIPRQGFDKLAN